MRNDIDHAVVDVNDVADYFIYKSQFDARRRSSISPLKLQKLLYYSQAWFYTLMERKLFSDKIEAWVHGPVVPSIYDKYKRYGYNDISKNVDNIPQSIKRNEDVKDILDAVWYTYNQFDAKTLEKISHMESPWRKARGDLKAYQPSNREITVEDMRNYYKTYI